MNSFTPIFSGNEKGRVITLPSVFDWPEVSTSEIFSG
jgi:hypothetical protein